MSCLPRTAIETDREAFNSLLRADGHTHWEALADWGNDPLMGQAGQNTNLTYYSSDATHPNAAGMKIGGTYIADAILPLMGNALPLMGTP